MLVISIIHLTRNQPPDKKDLSGRQESHPPAKRSHVWTAEVRPLQRRPCVDGRIPTPPKMGLVHYYYSVVMLILSLCFMLQKLVIEIIRYVCIRGISPIFQVL